MNFSDDVMTSPKSKRASGGDGGDDGTNVRLIGFVGTSAGIAAGYQLQIKGNAQVEWWTMFTTLDQLDTCLTTGPLRFENPILFAQFRRDLEDVCCQHPPLDTRVRPGHELRGAGA